LKGNDHANSGKTEGEWCEGLVNEESQRENELWDQWWIRNACREDYDSGCSCAQVREHDQSG